MLMIPAIPIIAVPERRSATRPQAGRAAGSTRYRSNGDRQGRQPEQAEEEQPELDEPEVWLTEATGGRRRPRMPGRLGRSRRRRGAGWIAGFGLVSASASALVRWLGFRFGVGFTVWSAWCRRLNRRDHRLRRMVGVRSRGRRVHRGVPGVTVAPGSPSGRDRLGLGFGFRLGLRTGAGSGDGPCPRSGRWGMERPAMQSREGGSGKSEADAEV